MPGISSCYVVTGNLTQAGRVVYLRADETWATSLAEAHPFATEEEAEAVLARVRAHEEVVTEPYVFEAQLVDGMVRPTSAREILRSAGPSTRLRRPDDGGAATASNESRLKTSSSCQRSMPLGRYASRRVATAHMPNPAPMP